jgi:hypothetical protein
LRDKCRPEKAYFYGILCTIYLSSKKGIDMTGPLKIFKTAKAENGAVFARPECFKEVRDSKTQEAFWTTIIPGSNEARSIRLIVTPSEVIIGDCSDDLISCEQILQFECWDGKENFKPVSSIHRKSYDGLLVAYNDLLAFSQSQGKIILDYIDAEEITQTLSDALDDILNSTEISSPTSGDEMDLDFL